MNGDSFTDYDAAYQRGARDIIDQNADSDEISGRILELANYHRIHEQMKIDFSALAVEAAADKTGIAFSQNFIRAHFPRLMRDAAKLNLPVSLIGMKLSSEAVGYVTTQAIESAYAQTGELLNNLVRMQDVVCRWDEDKFILAFFGTNRGGANICLLYTSPSPRDQRGSRMPSSA